MGGGDLNMKKSWHPLLRVNQERVWKQEKKAYEERKKLDELRRERDQEREMQELQRLQEEAGGKKRVDKVDWMYATPSGGSNGPSASELEEYLLGKKKVDQFINDKAKRANDAAMAEGGGAGGKSKGDTGFQAIQQNAGSSNDVAAKIREDPMFAIKQQEQQAYQALLKDPTRLRQMRLAAGLDVGDDSGGSSRPKRDRHDDRDGRRHRSGEGSSNSSSSRAHRREHRGERQHRERRRRDDDDDDDRIERRDRDRGRADRRDEGSRRSHRDDRDGDYARDGHHRNERESDRRHGGDRIRDRRYDDDREDRHRDSRQHRYSDRPPYDGDERQARRSRTPLSPAPSRSRSPDYRQRRTSTRADDRSGTNDHDHRVRNGDDGRSPPASASTSSMQRLRDQAMASRQNTPNGHNNNRLPHTVPAAPAAADADADADAERAAKLARMQSNAQAMNADRDAYLSKMKAEEAEEIAQEEKARERMRKRKEGSGQASFLLDQRKSQTTGGNAGMDLEERLKRGRGGLQKIVGD